MESEISDNPVLPIKFFIVYKAFLHKVDKLRHVSSKPSILSNDRIFYAIAAFSEETYIPTFYFLHILSTLYQMLPYLEELIYYYRLQTCEL